MHVVIYPPIVGHRGTNMLSYTEVDGVFGGIFRFRVSHQFLNIRQPVYIVRYRPWKRSSINRWANRARVRKHTIIIMIVQRK